MIFINEIDNYYLDELTEFGFKIPKLPSPATIRKALTIGKYRASIGLGGVAGSVIGGALGGSVGATTGSVIGSTLIKRAVDDGRLVGRAWRMAKNPDEFIENVQNMSRKSARKRAKDTGIFAARRTVNSTVNVIPYMDKLPDILSDPLMNRIPVESRLKNLKLKKA